MLIDILTRWNRWGKAILDPGIKRNILEELIYVLDMKEVVTLVGSRRAGKSTLMYQLIDYLEKSSVDPKAILHMNFEEPSLAENLNLSILDTIYETYRNEIYPKGKAYIFFDEIQNIEQWEKWVRARNETENIKIFITGSSSKLLSREFGTLLTGRHLTFEVASLSFSEFLQFNQISVEKDTPMFSPNPEINHALKQYLTWGSYPQITLTHDEQKKELLLKGYFDDILLKDIAMRHEIRDLNTLRNLALHLFAQTASLITYKRLSKLFGVSEKLVSNYCRFIQEAFLLDFLPFYSVKVAERNRNPIKVHVNDFGMRKLMSLLHSPDYGRIAETAIFKALSMNPKNEIYYWKGKGEVDFLVKQNNEVSQLIQVVYEGLDVPGIMQREIASLREAGEKFKTAEKLLIVGNTSSNFMFSEKDIHLIPLWKFLLS